MTIKIYQAKSDVDFKFMGFRFVEKFFNGNVNFDTNYKLVYEFEESHQGSTDSLLESIFMRFQGTKPSGYKGHSLSVSDIVEVDGVKYYADSFGFKSID